MKVVSMLPSTDWLPKVESNPAPSWTDQLLRRRPTIAQQTRGEQGSLMANLANAVTALQLAPEWAGVLAFDEFAVKVVSVRDAPWGKPPGKWTDDDTRHTAIWLQRNNLEVGTQTAGEAVETVARKQRIHPPRDFLMNLVWDGTPRIHNWARTYLGADKPICLIFARLFLIAGVARIFQPGCKVDIMLVLEGPQGARKSTAVRILGGEWFSDRMSEIGSKDSLLECHGVWILEHAELDALTRASDFATVKSFMSSASDRFRLPYGKTVGEFPRSCVFVGTTNKTDWIRDETGGRRFWPIRCGNIDIEALERDRAQLWAEAVHEFNEGHPWWLTEAESVRAAQQEQLDRYEGGQWDDVILPWLASRSDVSVGEVLSGCIRKESANWTQSDRNAVAKALRAFGWEMYFSGPRTARERRYRRPE